MNPKVIALCVAGAAAALTAGGYATGIIGGGDAEVTTTTDSTYKAPEAVKRDPARMGGPEDPFFSNPLNNVPIALDLPQPNMDKCETMTANGTNDPQQIRDCVNEVLAETQSLIGLTKKAYGPGSELAAQNPELAAKSARISADLDQSCIPAGKNFGDFYAQNSNDAVRTLNNFYNDIVVCLGALEAQQDIAAEAGLDAQSASAANDFNVVSSLWGETLQAYSASIAAKFGNQYAARDLAGIQHHIRP
jgi:hypothetical protein